MEGSACRTSHILSLHSPKQRLPGEMGSAPGPGVRCWVWSVGQCFSPRLPPAQRCSHLGAGPQVRSRGQHGVQLWPEEQVRVAPYHPICRLFAQDSAVSEPANNR